MLVRVAFLALAVTGCASEATVQADMESALTATGHAFAGSLLVTEFSQSLVAPPTSSTATPSALLRHAGVLCPSLANFGDVSTLDYLDVGCLPDSLLFPEIVGGHVEARVSGDVTFASPASVVWTVPAAGSVFELRPHELPVEGSLDTTLAGGPLSVDLVVNGTLSVPELSLRFTDVRVLRTEEEIRLVGQIDVDFGVVVPLDLDGVVIPVSDITRQCPTASAGNITSDDGDGPPVVLDFDAGKGAALDVTRNRRSAVNVSLCDYPSTLL